MQGDFHFHGDVLLADEIVESFRSDDVGGVHILAPDFQLPVMMFIGNWGLFIESFVIFGKIVFSGNVVVVDLQGFDGFVASEFRHGQQVVRKQLNQLCREIMPEAVSAVVDIQIFQKGSHDVPNRLRGQLAVLIIIAVADEQGAASHFREPLSIVF